MFLRRLFIRKEDYIKSGERPDLEVEAIKIALENYPYECCFKEGETFPYDSKDYSKRISIEFNTIINYCKEHNIHIEHGTNPENGFDMVTVFPKKRAV